MEKLDTTQVSQLQDERAKDVQVPAEVWDSIAQYIYDSSSGQADSLHSFSLVSRHIRKSALPFLFKSVSHGIRHTPSNDHGVAGQLHLLVNRPDLLSHVRTLTLVWPPCNPGPPLPPMTPEEEQEGVRNFAVENLITDMTVLRHSLPLMIRLRRIRLRCGLTIVPSILMLLPANKQYEIILNKLTQHGFDAWSSQEFVAAVLVCIEQGHHLALGTRHPRTKKRHPASQQVYDAMSRAKAMKFHFSWLQRQGFLQEQRRERRQRRQGGKHELETPGFRMKPSWTELQLVFMRDDAIPPDFRYPFDGEIIPWSQLERLSINWQYTTPMTGFVQNVGSELTSLRALRLYGNETRLFHPNCTHQQPTLGLLRDPPPAPPFKLNEQLLERLEELEIDGICNHIPITDLVGPNMRVLRLHCENARTSVRHLDSQRTHLDIRTAAKIARKLERLELDIGRIEHLWNPVAIPGMDVDVERYTFLSEVAKFPQLRFLRLFPPFMASEATSIVQVPVSDVQAIRIFDYIREQCPSFEVLSIAAAPSIVRVDTMCWEVQRQGSKTILTTGHKNRNYIHRQTWAGQRKISGEIKRFETPPPYLPAADTSMLDGPLEEEPGVGLNPLYAYVPVPS